MNENLIATLIILAVTVLTYFSIIDTDLFISMVTAFIGFLLGQKTRERKQ